MVGPNERERLVVALKRHSGKAWAATALSALEDPSVVVAGNSGSQPTGTVGDLTRLYRIRLAHCREQKVNAHGIAELLEALSGLPASEKIEIQPFLGQRSGVDAFWNEAGDLVGCVTVLDWSPDRGRANLEFALGKA